MGSTSEKSLYPKDGNISEKEDFSLGNNWYVREKECDLQKLFNNTWSGYKYFIRVYCDSLACDATSSLRIRLPFSYSIHIFVRDFYSQVAGLSEIVFEPHESKMIGEQQVCLYFGEAPPNLVVKQSSTPDARGIALTHDNFDCPSSGPYRDAGHDHINSFDFSASTTHPELEKVLDATTIDHKTMVEFMKAADKETPPTYPVSTAVGRRIRIFKDQPLKVELIHNVPVQELEPPNPTDFEVIGPDITRAENLSKLLRQEFQLVSDAILKAGADIPTAISRLRFIIRCARLSEKRANLVADAQNLLDQLELPRRALNGQTPPSQTEDQYYVPVLNMKTLIKRAKEGLARVRRAEDELITLDRELAHAAQLGDQFKTVLTAMANTMDGFMDEEANNKDKAIAAMQDCEAKRRDMEVYTQTTKTALKRFQAGIEAYKRDKEEEFEMKMIMAGVELGVSIGIAIATCGAGGPLTVGSLGAAQKAVTEGVKKMTQLAELIKNLIDTCAKILPKMIAAGQTQAKFNKSILYWGEQANGPVGGRSEAVEKSLENAAKAIGAKSMPQDLMTPIDYLGILADWEEFDINVDEMFGGLERSIGQDDIDGLTDYKIALKSQAVRGRTVLMAMRNVQEATHLYHRTKAEKAAREARKASLLALAQSVKETKEWEKVGYIVRWAMIEESINGRCNLWARCHQVLLGLIYFSNRPEQTLALLDSHPVRTNSTSSEFDTLLDAVDSAWDAAKRRGQTQSVEISTEKNPKAFSPDWKVQLSRNKRISFSVPTSNVKLLGAYHHIRVFDLSVTFEGMKEKEQTVTWEWELGPHFDDRTSGRKMVHYYMPPLRLKQYIKKGKVEGSWRINERDLVAPSLYCDGEIVFYDENSEGDGDIGNPDVDLSEVTNVVLEFQCEAILLGGD